MQHKNQSPARRPGPLTAPQPQHTPGPWFVLERYTNRNVYPIGYSIGNGAHSILAEVNSQGGTPDECSANARLIAAAPELFQALQAIEAILDGRQPKDVPGAVMVARHAIGKAQGEAIKWKDLQHG
jgi:hypothetical protein